MFEETNFIQSSYYSGTELKLTRMLSMVNVIDHFSFNWLFVVDSKDHVIYSVNPFPSRKLLSIAKVARLFPEFPEASINISVSLMMCHSMNVCFPPSILSCECISGT